MRLFLFDTNNGIVVGFQGTILRTTNGGANWTAENSGTINNLWSVTFTDANNGTIVGQGGTVLRTTGPALITANLKVYLEGPYAGGDTMTTTLKTNNLIPLNSDTAYPTIIYGYIASVVGSIPNSSIVDWVLVELRSGTASGTKVATRAAFLKNDGTIVDTDGSSLVTFSGLSADNYYVVVRHRNHLAIMTALAIPLSSSSTLYNFTTAQTLAYGSNPMKALTGGGYGMIAGDASRGWEYKRYRSEYILDTSEWFSL